MTEQMTCYRPGHPADDGVVATLCERPGWYWLRVSDQPGALYPFFIGVDGSDGPYASDSVISRMSVGVFLTIAGRNGGVVEVWGRLPEPPETEEEP